MGITFSIVRSCIEEGSTAVRQVAMFVRETPIEKLRAQLYTAQILRLDGPTLVFSRKTTTFGPFKKQPLSSWVATPMSPPNGLTEKAIPSDPTPHDIR